MVSLGWQVGEAPVDEFKNLNSAGSLGRLVASPKLTHSIPGASPPKMCCPTKNLTPKIYCHNKKLTLENWCPKTLLTLKKLRREGKHERRTQGGIKCACWQGWTSGVWRKQLLKIKVPFWGIKRLKKIMQRDLTWKMLTSILKVNSQLHLSFLD